MLCLGATTLFYLLDHFKAAAFSYGVKQVGWQLRTQADLMYKVWCFNFVIGDGQSPKKEECLGINGCKLSLGELSRLIPELYVQVTVQRDQLRINNQLDASNIQNLFCHETLHVSGIFSAHHQELSAVHLAIGMFHAVIL